MNICIKFEQLYCCLCLQPSESHLCNYCYRDLPWIGFQCSRCGQSLESEGLVCGACLRSPPAFDAAIVPLAYEKPISQMIWRLKFGHQRYYAYRLAELFLSALPVGDLPDVIIPMPMHPWRLFLRGFNQTIYLGAPIAKALGVPFRVDILKRIRHTNPQRILTKVERRKNLSDAFAIKGSVEGLHIAVLDDVITTGASAHYASLCLKNAGASRVDLWAIAATLLHK